MKENSLRILRSIVVGGVIIVGLTSCRENAAPPAPTEPAAKAPETGEVVKAPVAEKTDSWLNEFFGQELVRADGTKVPVSSLKGKTIGLYFSAHWCPPCRSFTPKLVKAYDEMVAAKKPFEMVFVSSDRDEKAMTSYMNGEHMKWVAIPYDSKFRRGLGERFGVRGIPSLIIVDENGKTVTKSARSDVSSKGAAAFDKW